MTLRKLLEFKIFGVDGYHIESLFCNIKNMIKQNGSVTRDELKAVKSLDTKKREDAIDTLEKDGFIKIAKDGIITITKEIDYGKNEQCSV